MLEVRMEHFQAAKLVSDGVVGGRDDIYSWVEARPLRVSRGLTKQAGIRSVKSTEQRVMIHEETIVTLRYLIHIQKRKSAPHF